MNATAVIAHLSRERIEPYALRAGDDGVGLDLYHWDSQAGAEFHILLGCAEVTLRNALHKQLTAIAAKVSTSDPWYVTLAPILDPKSLDDITEAKRRAALEGKPESEGRVVAELSFGFWRYLVSAKYDRTLWRAGLSKAFPHLDAPLRQVSKRLYRLNQIRNRICHHEPVFNRDLHGLRRDVDQLFDWIDPGMALWTGERCQLATLLASPPARIGP